MSELKQITGYHVTRLDNFQKIQRQGLKGSKWQKKGFTHSWSNPFKLYANGAVFCFTRLQDAIRHRDDFDMGTGTVILKIIGHGVQFEHYAEGQQIAVRANTATYEKVA